MDPDILNLEQATAVLGSARRRSSSCFGWSMSPLERSAENGDSVARH